MLIVIGTITVPPADLQCFVDEVGLLAAVTRQRGGNLFYETAVLDTAAGRLLVTERWCDEAALTSHLRADDTVAFVLRWRDRMVGDVRKYNASDELPIEAWLDKSKFRRGRLTREPQRG